MSRPPRRLNFLPSSRSPSGVGGLEADEDAPAPGSRGQRHEFLVIGEVDRDLGDPLLSQVGLGHGAEQLLGARQMLGSRADEIVVHHKHALLADQAELPHDIRDGSLPVAGSVDRRHAAEAAAQGAAARGLDRPEEVPRRQEIMTCRRDLVQLEALSVIAALQVAVPGVVQDLRPDGIGFPRDHRIHPLHDFVCAGGRVNAAHDDGDAETAEVGGHFVGAVRLRGEGGDADQVRARHGRIVRHAEVLVYDRDLPRRRGQTGEGHEAERLPHAVAVPAVLLDPDHAHERVGWVDQTQSHGVLALIGGHLRLVLSATGWPLHSRCDDTRLRECAKSRLI